MFNEIFMLLHETYSKNKHSEQTYTNHALD